MPAAKQISRSEARLQRLAAFAFSFCRLGTATAAYRETHPKSITWKPDSVAKEASRLMRDQVVQAHIQRIQEDARLDAIANRQEIARVLADIMRGNITQTVVQKVRQPDGSIAAQAVQVPPPIAQRISAARQLHKMLPEVEPKTTDASASAPLDDAGAALNDRLIAIRKRTKDMANHEKPL